MRLLGVTRTDFSTLRVPAAQPVEGLPAPSQVTLGLEANQGIVYWAELALPAVQYSDSPAGGLVLDGPPASTVTFADSPASGLVLGGTATGIVSAQAKVFWAELATPAQVPVYDDFPAGGLVLDGNAGGAVSAQGRVFWAELALPSSGVPPGGIVLDGSASSNVSQAGVPLTFYLVDAKAGTSNHGSLQQGGVAPTSARIGSGWVVATNTPTRYARLAYGAERASSAQLTTPVEPSSGPNNAVQTGAGDSFRSTNPLSGSFAAGNWTVSLEVQGETRVTSTHDGLLRIRVWKSVNEDGSAATELTTSTATTSGYTDLANTAAQQLTATINLPAATFSGEYLFVQIAHQLDGAGGNANSDTHLRVGANNTVVTTAFGATNSRAVVYWAELVAPPSVATGNQYDDLPTGGLVVDGNAFYPLFPSDNQSPSDYLGSDLQLSPTPTGGLVVDWTVTSTYNAPAVPTGGTVLDGVVTSGVQFDDATATGPVLDGATTTSYTSVDADAGGPVLDGLAVSTLSTASDFNDLPVGGIVLGGANTDAQSADFSPTGGLALGGGSADALVVLYTTPAGNLVLDGTGVGERVNADAPSGGLVTGGTATSNLVVFISYTDVASGGLTPDGTVTSGVTFADVPATGLRLDGANQSTLSTLTNYEDEPGGGINLAGTATSSHSYDYAPSEGLALDGVTDSQVTFADVPATGLVLDGAAVSSTFVAPTDYTDTPTGGLVYDGVVYTDTYDLPAGGLVLNGVPTVETTWSLAPAGGLVLDGRTSAFAPTRLRVLTISSDNNGVATVTSDVSTLAVTVSTQNLAVFSDPDSPQNMMVAVEQEALVVA